MRKLIYAFIFSLLLLVGCKDNGTDATNIDSNNDTTPVGERCKYSLSDCDGEKLKKSVQCLGTTKTGERCKNKTTNSCGFCTTHKEQFSVGDLCPNHTTNESGFCDYHQE